MLPPIGKNTYPCRCKKTPLNIPNGSSVEVLWKLFPSVFKGFKYLNGSFVEVLWKFFGRFLRNMQFFLPHTYPCL